MVYAASSNTLKIVQVIKNQHLVVAQGSSNGSTSPGQTYLVNFPDDQQCSIVLREVQGNQYTFSTSSCDREDFLKKNLEVEPSLVSVPAEESKPVRAQSEDAPEKYVPYTQRPVRFGLVVHYNSADNIEFTDTIGRDVSFNGNSVFGLGVRGMILEPNTFGLIGSIEYEFKRTFDSITGDNFVATFTTKPELSMFFIEGGFAYRWDRFYLPFGLNYSIPQLSNAEGEKAIGTLGGMVGFGMFPIDNVSFEALIRVLGVRFKDDFYDDVYGTGFVSGFVFSGTYWF